MTLAVDQKIRESFSKSACHYETHAGIQKEIGLRLLGRMNKGGGLSRVLDIGMGTGWLNLKIKERYSRAFVVGLDFAKGMLDYAKAKNNVCDAVLADARMLPFRNNFFDCAISNVAYQWVDGLREAFRAVYSVLKKDGLFYLSCFGSKTFDEFFVSFEQTKNGIAEDTEVNRLNITAQAIESALKSSGFRNIEIEREFLSVSFKNLLDLMTWIKRIGANPMRPKGHIGRRWIERAEVYAQNHFTKGKGIEITFEVIWAKATK